jgi:hypothetical protein
MILNVARADLIDKVGLALPTTMDELIKVCDAVHGKDSVAAWTADKLHHWNWIPYLQGMGGRVFKDPPKNLTPLLDTDVAAKSAAWYANLITKYGPSGILSFTDDQAMQSQLSGRANMRSQAITWGLPLAKDPNSTVKNTVRYGMVPAGPLSVELLSGTYFGERPETALPPRWHACRRRSFLHPKPTPNAGTKPQILRSHWRRKNSKLRVVSIIFAKMILSAGPR